MKQLPEDIALDKAINGQRLYQGKIEIKKMSRLIDMLANSNGEVNYTIQFARAARILGKAQVQVNADLSLICTISQKEFIFPVELDSTIGFIDDLAYEDRLGVNMEASWVEDGYIKPLEIIEDELILAIPDSPYDENQIDDSVKQETVITETRSNPFNVLKDLK